MKLDDTQDGGRSEEIRRARVSDQYVVRQADLSADESLILSLWQHVSDENPPDAKKLDWFYRRNPAGPGQAYLLIFEPESRPVGIICVGRRRIQVNGRILNAAVFGDFAIDPLHRSLGPALLFQKRFLESALSEHEVVYGFPNANSAKVRSFGGYRMDSALDTYVLPIQSSYFLKRHMPTLLASLIAPCVRLWIWARVRIARASIARQYDFGPVDSLFIDEIWSHAAVQDCNMGVRDRAFAAWRFENCATERISLVGARDNTQRPAAFIASRVQKKGFVEVLDYLAIDVSALAALLANFVSAQFGGETVSVKIDIPSGDTELTRALQTLGFSRRGQTRYFVAAGTASVESSIVDDIRFSLADNDV